MPKILSYQQASHQLSLIEKIGQLFMPAAFINDSEEEIQALEQLICENHVGGLCFFHSRSSAATNFEGKKKVLYNKESFRTLQNLVERYQKKAKHRLLIAIDAEWGLAMRIENTPQYPYAVTMGAIQDNTDLVFQVGKNIAHDCKQAGIHYNLAPVVDINNNPKNPVIGYRSFGEDKINVTKNSLAYLKGIQSEGVIGSIKHFPGHGDTAIDSHLGLPIIEKSKEELLNNELYPFRKLIEEGVDSVMVGHLCVPALSQGKQIPSSISKDMIKGVLRHELGFKGVVISDALNMHAVSKNHPVKGELEWLAFDAGNDILCFAEHIAAGIRTISEKTTQTQIEEAFKRVWSLKEKAIRAEVGSRSELSDPDYLNTEIAKASITMVQGNKDDIANFRKDGFIGITNSTEVDKSFLGMLNGPHDFRTYSLKVTMDSSLEGIEKEGNILLSLEPPQVKPTHNFGFTDDEINKINELLNTGNVVLYLFGNPYALQLFDYHKAHSTVVAYQNFKVFQEVAASHFKGSITAKGKLPVELQ
ncbi:glycoside hydrolase family 3 protein [Maribacter sp. ANRC-HE7]|uniref:beta-N-acetylhexosaminidase n=1 Tax=Maribacter aquimaris TaxID=2737171 RepID=A0ABR7V6M7_9FLAO|nr:glycoside hydrolase family 3 protein [Maribacter aquimaris]MBD0778788.1 glycoside hydrolase family 3 protein [Maribacter aquimaris]